MNDLRSAARHKRRVVEATANPPSGVVVLHDGVQSSHASLVKYIARHVSDKVPEGNNRLATDTQILRDTFADFDRGRVPEKLGVMMETLLCDRTMVLEEELYKAAFATELLGPWGFPKKLVEEDFRRKWTHDLLRGGGYDVHL